MVIILLIILYILFYLFTNKTTEHYTKLLNNDFFDYLKKKNYDVDIQNKIISKDGNQISFDKSFNDIEAIENSNNKYKTNKILKKNNIPVPKSILIENVLKFNINSVISQMKKLNMDFPVIVKPIKASLGKGVETNIIDNKTLNEIIINHMKVYFPKDLVLEEQVDGNSYRIILFNNEIIDIINRKKPFVIGNGNTTIQKLINDLNSNLENKGDSRIIKNYNHRYINQQGYDLNDKLELNNKIYLTNVINSDNGAILKKVKINKIPIENINLFKKVAKVMDLKLIGIDFMSNDIMVPYYENNATILEVNSRPGIGLHLEENQVHVFYDKLIKNLF